MKIGTIDLGERPVTLAPMEDVTDASFRILCREAGAARVTTEFVSSDGLVRDVSKTIAKMHTLEEEAPVAVQIYGCIPEAMVDAARMAANAKELAGITKAIVEAVPHKPVTVKTRLGWDDNSKIIVELAERLQDVGIQALTIHGRTRCQMYKGEADWTLIGAVKNNPRMHIPIIGNGDINSAAKAREAFDKYGVDGIMVGRASFGHPWIFTEIRHLLDTGEELPPMNVQDRVALAKRHFQLSLDLKEMRRHLSCYFKGLRDFKDTRIKLVTSKDPAEIMATLDYVAERWGAEAPEAEGVYGL